jgi:hypothetical protein
MERKAIFVFGLIVFLALAQFAVFVSAQENEEGDDDDPEIYGLELEKVLMMITAWISIFLFVLTFMAYKRDGRKRLLYVALGFLLFAIKNFLISSELYLPEISWFDPTAVALEFVAILSFFFGVIKR